MRIARYVARYIAIAGASGAIACSSSSGSGGPPAVMNAGNGVDDVVQACVIRSRWMQAGSSACRFCVEYSPMAPCTCEMDPNWGKCQTQAQAKQAEPECASVGGCVATCAPQDCACVDGCYVGHDPCRTVAAAFDGCVASVCDSACR